MAALDLTSQRIAELFLEVDTELYALTDRRHDLLIVMTIIESAHSGVGGFRLAGLLLVAVFWLVLGSF